MWAAEDRRTNRPEGDDMKVAVLAAAALTVVVAAAGASTASTRNGRILFTETYAYSGGFGSIYAINADGSGRVLISDNAVNGSWSPDGRTILFESSRNGDPDMWSIHADGSSPRELTFTIGVHEDGSWSPDGAEIAFESGRNNPGGGDVFVMDEDG